MPKHRNHTNIKIKYVTNNQEFINRSNKHLNYRHSYPKNTLSAEYDITEKIYLSNKIYKISASFQHIYSHKDTKSRGYMSIEAKPNVVADKLVVQYQQKIRLISTNLLYMSICIYCIRNQWDNNNKQH